MKSFEIAILGSGFASSLCAAILAKHGRRVVLIDRGRHPRFAIGESTTPAADFLLHHLAQEHGLQELIPLTRYGSWIKQYPHVRCGCKRGFSYVWHGDGSQYCATETHDNELMVTANASDEVADTQWYRPDVDAFFLGLAKSYGAVCMEETSVNIIDSDRIGHQLSLSVQGELYSLSSSFVIDGSGPNSIFMQRHGGDDWTDRLLTNTSAVYGHFVGGQVTEKWLKEERASVADFPYPFDLAAVHHLFRDGWLWQIGFDGDLTSLGFVFNHLGLNGFGAATRSDNWIDSNSPEFAKGCWQSILDHHPVLKGLYGCITCNEFPGRLFHVPRIQRLREKAAGENWAALSFTCGFIDPLHSTGIAHTLSTVERICNILLGGDRSTRARQLEEYSRQVVGELFHIDKIIATCYASMHEFKLFAASTMIYFAAAIALERHRGLNLETGFLLARDPRFCEIVDEVYSRARGISEGRAGASQEVVRRLIGDIEVMLQPYNDVGLFSPATNNMILHTAASK